MNELKRELDFLESYFTTLIEVNVKGLESVKEHLQMLQKLNSK